MVAGGKPLNGRREISLDDLADAKKRGLDHILDNMEVKGVAVIKDKHGNVKGKLNLTRINDAISDDSA